MSIRRLAAIAAVALLAIPSLAAAQATTPSATTIERQLNAAPRAKIRPEQKVTVREFKRRPDLRRMAPSIDIQSINFAFGSAEIPFSQYRKVENIADALDQLLDRRPNSKVLIELLQDTVLGASPCLNAEGRITLPDLPQRRRTARRTICQPCTITHNRTTSEAFVRGSDGRN